MTKANREKLHFIPILFFQSLNLGDKFSSLLFLTLTLCPPFSEHFLGIPNSVGLLDCLQPSTMFVSSPVRLATVKQSDFETEGAQASCQSESIISKVLNNRSIDATPHSVCRQASTHLEQRTCARFPNHSKIILRSVVCKALA